MDETSIKHKCFGCKKTHADESWRWHTGVVNNKKVFYCGKCIDCKGCGFIHYNDTGGSRTTSEGSFCRKHFDSKPSREQRIRNMSPEQVLSGGLHGLPNQFGANSEDWKSQKKEVRKVLE